MKWVLVGIIIFGNTLGDVLNTAGMKRHGEVEHFNPHALGRMVVHVLQNPFVLGGIASLTMSFAALVMVLSVAPVSFAVPATAGSFVLETTLAKLVLKEQVNWKRWLGATLVGVGVALLSL